MRRAAALGAAELQVLQQGVALSGIHDGLKVSGPLGVATLAPDEGQTGRVGAPRAPGRRKATVAPHSIITTTTMGISDTRKTEHAMTIPNMRSPCPTRSARAAAGCVCRA